MIIGGRVAFALALLCAASVAQGQPPVVRVRATVDTTAVLRPGDVVRLRIWREPDLSGDFPVDESGFVVLPKVGPLQVTAESPTTLKARLVDAYEAFLNQVSIDVVLLRRVQVLGAVRSPGLYQVDPTMVLSDVVALAGGTTNQGNLKGLAVIRDGRKLPRKLSQNDRVGTSLLRSGDQIYVPEKSWISRNPGFVTAMIGTAVTVSLALWRGR